MTERVLNELEFEAARTGDHAGAAERMAELAAGAGPGCEVSRAEALVRAGEQWQLADDHDRAVELFRQAIADGGPTFIDPRACLVVSLFELGRQVEARGLIAEIKADRPDDPKVYQWIAEALLDAGDLEGAHAWATEGVEMCRRDGTADVDLNMLLRIRYRVRVDLGLAEDDYDRLLDTLADR